MTQVRLWTIIGESGTGKSRSVKTLASRGESGPPGFYDILLRGGGYLQVLGKVMAWQEDQKTPDQSVAEINKRAQSRTSALGGRQPAFVNILSALRFDPVTINGVTYPAGADYLERWAAEGWSLESLVLMSPDRSGGRDFYGAFGVPTLWHYDARELAIESMAGAIRNHFGWA